MNQSMQIEILKELIHNLDHHTTVDAGKVVMNPTSSYTSAELAAQEWTTFFQNHPQVVGLSGDLPRPGTYITRSDFGVPIIATRDDSGRFRAFVNACRHRGAQITDAPSGEKSRFTCPFHGWTYGNDGRLIGVREAEHFGAVDKACHRLVELPAAERYGLLFVHPQVDGVLDVDALLGDLAGELATWDLGACTQLGESVLDMPLNWKIANDTFGEVYHFQSLHRNTLANLFHGDAATYREFGRHHRICLAGKYLDSMRRLPEKTWSLTDAGVVAYYLFPNVQIVMFNRVIAFARIYMDPHDVRHSITHVTHYGAPHIGTHEAPQPAQTLSGENLYKADTTTRVEFNLATQLELFVSTVEHEDYAMGLKTQQAADSGKLEYFLFGRNEPALHHFHNNYRDALGLPPLEDYRAVA